MQTQSSSLSRIIISEARIYLSMAIGAFLAAFAIVVFFIPHNLIDGGVVGVSMIFGNLTNTKFIPYFILLLNIPFLLIAHKAIGKSILIHMFVANILFAGSMFLLEHYLDWKFQGENLEVVVIGGAILGIGIGMIIRVGGCIDGTEILGIIINRRFGLTVGQVVLFCNIFIFCAVGLIFKDWHPPILSLIAFMIASKVMDAVIVGLEETKSVIIISKSSKMIAEAIIKELNLGVTVMYGRGGYSGVEKEILYVIVERLQLADLKEIIFGVDPQAFIAIENLHEVVNGMKGSRGGINQARIERIVAKIIGAS